MKTVIIENKLDNLKTKAEVDDELLRELVQSLKDVISGNIKRS